MKERKWLCFFETPYTCLRTVTSELALHFYSYDASVKLCFRLLPVGVYTVTVRATNAVSNSSTSVEFTVQQQVSGLSVNASSEYVFVGDEVFFQAFVSGGTDIHFDWSFGDLETAADAGKLYY